MPDEEQPEASTTPPAPLVTPPGRALDPMVALATSVHASPGVYALLLGSGISSAAGVPTGWQVVADLVGRMAAAQAPDDPEAANAAKDDPETWWSQHGPPDPLGYSALLHPLAPTPAARQALLARYFEPTDADREEGRKVPGIAHHAIAQLVARGSIRVILTTNFDRLLERALEEAGVPPQTLHRPEQLAAATPLAHARATIIKLHGDYADLDQRNTADELAQYPDTLAAYLGRVLDEYGLIISGWSADWDIALVQSFEEARSRRYPMFWSSYSTISETARRLIALHGAVPLPGLTAEDLFTGLQSRLEALDRLSNPPITADIAVQRLKRALPDPRRRIELFDLVNSEVQQLTSVAADITRHPLGGVLIEEQLAAYEQEAATSTRLLATGVFHGEEQHTALWLRSLRHLLSARRPIVGGYDSRLDVMRHYPALLCLWAMGISAILTEQEKLLTRLLLEPTWMPIFGERKPEPPVHCLNPLRIIPVDPTQTIPNLLLFSYPQSHHIRTVSRNAFKGIEPDEETYSSACDRLEYLASLIAMSDPDEHRRYPWAGEFIGNSNYLDKGQDEITAAWPLLEGGAFNGDPEQAKTAHTRLTGWIAQPGRAW